MILQFHKYHGTGNDFIMIDNLNRKMTLSEQQIKRLCHRHFGIGADGLILIEPSIKYDFYMKYHNADGKESSMCGNGGRCSVHFAQKLGVFTNQTTFEAADGVHHASLVNEVVSLQMTDVKTVELFTNHCFLDTGSPHHVQLVQNLDKLDVNTLGKQIRNGSPYFEEGTNVNFVEALNHETFKVRTYERGVENETLSCGTGATAVAIAMYASKKTNSKDVNLETKGGQLSVTFEHHTSNYTNIILRGYVSPVFTGSLNLI